MPSHPAHSKHIRETPSVRLLTSVFLKTCGDDGATEDKLAANLVAVDADTWRIKSSPRPSKATSDYAVATLRQFQLILLECELW